MLAPEMISGMSYDHRIDAWALGILLFEMLLGSSPFVRSGEGAATTCKRILSDEISDGRLMQAPPGAQPLIRGLLQRDPDRRVSLNDVLGSSWLVDACRGRELALQRSGRCDDRTSCSTSVGSVHSAEPSACSLTSTGVWSPFSYVHGIGNSDALNTSSAVSEPSCSLEEPFHFMFPGCLRPMQAS